MRIGFPYLPLIKNPKDFVSYAIIRCLCSPRLMSFAKLRLAIQRWFPYVIVRPRPIRGLQLFLSTKDSSQAAILDEVFLENVYNLNNVPFIPSHVIDCGAHVGMFALLAYDRFPKAAFSLFEPNPDNLTMLRKTLSANNFKCALHESAVSDRNGSASFQAKLSYGGHLLLDDAPADGAFQVQCIDLVEYIRQNVIGNLVLKLDIEGHEMVVLPAIVESLPKKTVIFFETHSGQDGWEKLSDCLTRAGFTVKRTRWRHPYADGFAVRNE